MTSTDARRRSDSSLGLAISQEWQRDTQNDPRNGVLGPEAEVKLKYVGLAHMTSCIGGIPSAGGVTNQHGPLGLPLGEAQGDYPTG